VKKRILFKCAAVLFIAAAGLFLLLQMYPERSIEVHLQEDISPIEIKSLIEFFPDSEYHVEKKADRLIVTGRGLNDAILNGIKIIPGVVDARFLKTPFEKRFGQYKLVSGIQFSGGTRLVLMPNFEGIEEKLKSRLSDNEKKEITRVGFRMLKQHTIRRYSFFDPFISIQNKYFIEVLFSGVKLSRLPKKRVLSCGEEQVYFAFIDEEKSMNAKAWLQKYLKGKEIPRTYFGQESLLEGLKNGIDLSEKKDLKLLYERDPVSKKIVPIRPVVLDRGNRLELPPVLKTRIEKINDNNYYLHFKLTKHGNKHFEQFTRDQYPDKPFAISLDDKVRSIKKISGMNSEGWGFIAGIRTIKEADLLSRILQESVAPIHLKIISHQEFSPAAGEDKLPIVINALIILIFLLILISILSFRLKGGAAVFSLAARFIWLIIILSFLQTVVDMQHVIGLAAALIFFTASDRFLLAALKNNNASFNCFIKNHVPVLLLSAIIAFYGFSGITGFGTVLFLAVMLNIFPGYLVTAVLVNDLPRLLRRA